MKTENLNAPELRRVSSAVENLSRPEAPKDLAARTVARVWNEARPVKKVRLWLRPITNPVARLAAAAAIIFCLAPLTDLDWAEPLGKRIERFTGAQTVTRVEGWLDTLLLKTGPAAYSSYELDAFVGTRRPFDDPNWRWRRLRQTRS